MTVPEARALLGPEDSALTDREVEELVTGYGFLADLMITHQMLQEPANDGPAEQLRGVVRSAHQ